MNRKEVDLIRKALNYFETGFSVLENLLGKNETSENTPDPDENEDSYKVKISESW